MFICNTFVQFEAYLLTEMVKFSWEKPFRELSQVNFMHCSSIIYLISFSLNTVMEDLALVPAVYLNKSIPC